MMDLNDDVIAHIMLCFDMDQVNDCFRLASTCSRFYSCLQKNKIKIDDHFTYVIMSENRESHYYGNKFYRSSKTSSYGRDSDKPAVIWKNGTQMWYRHGKRHRDGKPAIIWFDGSQWWYKYGKRYYP